MASALLDSAAAEGIMTAKRPYRAVLGRFRLRPGRRKDARDC